MLPCKVRDVWWMLLVIYITIGHVRTQSTGVCGGQRRQQNGVISSPNYPENYPDNQECHWTIIADPTNLIDIRFSKLDLEGTASSISWISDTCPDYVMVYDGDSTNAPTIIILCRIKTQAELAKIIIRSKTNKMHIVFYSDYQGQRPGFVASYWTHECPPFTYGDESCNNTCKCIEENTVFCNNTSGECLCKKGWTSPDCSQDVNECLNPQVEPCPYDYMECVNTLGSFYCICKAGLIANESGECEVRPTAVCDQENNCSHLCVKISDESPTPQQHCYCPDNMQLVGNTCKACSNLAFGKDCRLSCPCYSIGTYSCDTTTGGCICSRGFTSPDCSRDIDECTELRGSVCPTSDELCVNTFGGYDCKCRSGVERSPSGSCAGCSYTITNSSGVIQSPNYPNDAYQNVNCNWTILATGSGATVSFRLSLLNLAYKSDDYCYYGTLAIYDGGNSSAELLGLYCGYYNNDAGIIRSSGATMYLEFHSGYYYSRRFMGTYSTSDYKVFTSEITDPSGSIASPGYPVSYDYNVSSSWTITVLYGNVVTFSFLDFDLGKCETDYVDIYDGAHAGNKRLAHLCGSSLPNKTSSSKNTIHIIYSSYGNTSERGFNGSYITDACYCSPSFTASCNSPTGPCVCKTGYTGSYCNNDIDECQSNPCPLHSTCYNYYGYYSCICWNGTQINPNGSCDDYYKVLTNQSGDIQSQGYPNVYPGFLNYTYAIIGPKNTVVSFKFSHFDVYASYKCYNDKVEVYDVKSSVSQLIGQYCGINSPGLLRTFGNEMLVIFRTNYFNYYSAKGFNGTYYSHECPFFMYGEESCSSPCSCAYDTTKVCDNTNGVCLCKTGWVGRGCSQDLDECLDPEACPINSVCYNQPGTYSCECYSGYLMNDTTDQCEESSRCSEEMKQKCSHLCDVDETTDIERCYCPEDLVLLEDDFTCVVSLYPHGSEAYDFVAFGGTPSGAASYPVIFSSLVPVGPSFQHAASIQYNGVILFDEETTMNNPDLKAAEAAKQSLIAPFWTEKGDFEVGEVFHHLYEKCGEAAFYGSYPDSTSSPKEQEVVERAIRDINKLYSLSGFEVSLVFVVTWKGVQIKDCEDQPTNTFQAVLISGYVPETGQTYLQGEEKSFVFFIYKDGNGICKPGQPFEIGVVTDSGIKTLDIDKYTSQLSELIGNAGYRRMASFHIGQAFGESLMCQRYLCKHAGFINNQHFKSEVDELYQCPCSLDRLGLQWQLVKDESNKKCYAISAIAKRRLLKTNQRNRLCCYSWTPPKSDSWEDWHASWIAGSFIPSGHILVGDPWPGIPSFGDVHSYQNAQENMQARSWCCEYSPYALCNRFYHIFGDLQCTHHPVFVPASALGDPIFVTSDNKSYPMNAEGEFVLVEVDSCNNTLQARTQKVEFDGILSNGTVFTAFAAQEDNDNIQVQISSTNTSMVILVNHMDFTNRFYAHPDFIWTTLSMNVRRINENSRIIVAVSSSCGVSFKVNVGIKSLEIVTELDVSLWNKTRGLLGNYNGDPNDDYLLPNGTILPSTLTERETFELFAKEYLVSKDTSAFTNEKGESNEDYHKRKQDLFCFDEVEPYRVAEAREFCGNDSSACILDFTATRNHNFARNTKERKKITDQKIQRFANNPPTITGPNNTNYWLVYEGRENILQIEINDKNNDTVTIELLGNITGVKLYQNGTIIYRPDLKNPIQLHIQAEDSAGCYSSILIINIIVCPLCNNHGDCDIKSASTEYSEQRQYQILRCNCYPPYTGEACESEFNACELSPCSLGQNCTDLTAAEQGNSFVGHRCGPCPPGTTNVNGSCKDVNECHNKSVCDHECIDTYRSYQCRCRPGFRLDPKDRRTCNDINECVERTCACEQICRNNPGSYSCDCIHGYTLNTDGRTCIIGANISEVCQPCQQVCTVTDGLAICGCKLGYKVDESNSNNCTDIDECKEMANLPCSQKCVNTLGKYQCACNDGYRLDKDGFSCLKCNSFQFGENCSSTCNCRGRGTCDPVLGCVCDDGWSGTNCDKDTDECAVPNTCPNGFVCQNEQGSFRCNCPTGYHIKNGVCSDIDECSEYINKCDLMFEDCYNNVGSHSCICKEGFKRSEETGLCEDVDECKEHNDGCEHICQNGHGSYGCACHQGYSLAANRHGCEKYKDVCSLNCSHGCSLDVEGRPFCICPRGYHQTEAGACEDINECAISDDNPCAHKDHCINTDGNFLCSCDPGYKLDNDDRSCVACSDGTWGLECNNSCACGKEIIYCDKEIGCICKPGCSGVYCTDVIDRCASGELTCQPNEECVISGCSSVCQCRDGFVWDNGQCQDVNECLKTGNKCDQLCINTEGSYDCSCNLGYSYNSATYTCNDDNECETGHHNCVEVCTNTKGSFLCSCNHGYIYNTSTNTCSDENECLDLNRHDCDQVCTNTEGSFVCSCNHGYSYNSTANTCQDDNECETGHHNCVEACTNTKGSFICSCNPGYNYDASTNTCSDENECLNPNRHNCDQVCTNTEGSYVCSCNSGYNYNSTTNTCQDVDECQSSPCSQTCVNTNGSYHCVCRQGQFLLNDSVTCGACPNGCPISCLCVEDNTEHCDKTIGQCNCKTGWTSDNCSVDVDECLRNPCPDNRVCRNLIGSYECVCWNGLQVGPDGTCRDCNKTLTAQAGYIMSPNYPDPYDPNSFCWWTITNSNPNIVIELSLIAYDVEVCRFDYVTIYSGVNDQAPLLGWLCYNWQTFFISRGNNMHIVFKSDYFGKRKGFLAYYTSHLRCKSKTCSHTCSVVSSNPWTEKCQCPEWMKIDQSNDSKCININACNTTITESAGYVVSSNYPEKYSANSNCHWTIHGSQNSTVKLSFFDFDVENSYQCGSDFVKIYDGINETAPKLGHFCGRYLPPNISSSGSVIYIVFKSNSFLNYKGFKARFVIKGK